MSCNQTMVAVLSMMLSVLPLAAIAQGSAPSAPSAASVSVPPRIEQNPPPRARGDTPAEADARHCLELATNLEVIACAEKYRVRKGKR